MKIEDIVFWVFIIAVILIALWLLSGSPPEINALISIALFVASSEILLWRKLFEIDKKAAVSYAKVKEDLETIKSLIKNK